MNHKRYVVAEFEDNSVECFPRKWLSGELKVLWPRGLSAKALENAISGLESPKKEWEVYSLRRVLAQSGSFSGAKKKAAKAEYTSCISETEPEIEAGKRKIVCPERYLDGEAVAKRRVPRESEETDSDGSVVDRIAVPSFPEGVGTSSTKRKAHGAVMLSAQKGTVEESVDVTVLFREVLKEVQSLKYEVRSLKGMLLEAQAHSCRNSGSNAEVVSSLSTLLPVTNDDKMFELCARLADEDARTQLIHHLSLIGGVTEVHLIRNILRRVLTNDMCKSYSCCGKNGKKNLSALAVYNVIESAVRKKFPEVTDAEMRVKIGRYLTGANDRNGGRKNRGENCSNVTLQNE